MKIKLLLTGLFIAFSVMAMKAEEEASHYLHIQDVNGWTVLNLDNVDRLLFSNGDMKAVDKDNMELGTYSRSSLKAMYVDEKADLSVINDLHLDKSTEATFSLSETGIVTILTDGDFDAYGVNGDLLVHIAGAKANQTVDLSAVTEDFIILKLGKYALKVLRK